MAVVLPYGSRVATSRINFRLLARDALTNGKRLAIVAADAATRALAASAGLPVFASVGEYESSVEAGGPDGRRGGAAPGSRRRGSRGRDRRDRRAGATGDDEPMLVSETVATPQPTASRQARRRGDGCGHRRPRRRRPAKPRRPRPRRRRAASRPPRRRPTPVPVPAPASGARSAADPGRRSRRPASWPTRRPRPPTSAIAATRPEPRRPPRSPVGRSDAAPRRPGGARARRRRRSAWPAPSCSCPTATVAITPARGDHRPESLRIAGRARRPREPDAGRRSCRPSVLTIDVEASDTFPATGKRVEEDEGDGHGPLRQPRPDQVEHDPQGQRRQHGLRDPLPDRPGGHRPAGGARRADDRPVAAPRSTVTAVDAGPEGNVEPNAITTVPARRGAVLPQGHEPGRDERRQARPSSRG